METAGFILWLFASKRDDPKGSMVMEAAKAALVLKNCRLLLVGDLGWVFMVRIL